MLFLAGNTNKALFRRYTHCFGRTGCNNFTIPKVKTKGSNKRDGGSNAENLSGESANNHAFGIESIRVIPPFIISGCTVYISSFLFRMSAKCVRSLSRTIGRVSTERQKESHCFLNLSQMRTNE